MERTLLADSGIKDGASALPFPHGVDPHRFIHGFDVINLIGTAARGDLYDHVPAGRDVAPPRSVWPLSLRPFGDEGRADRAVACIELARAHPAHVAVLDVPRAPYAGDVDLRSDLFDKLFVHRVTPGVVVCLADMHLAGAFADMRLEVEGFAVCPDELARDVAAGPEAELAILDDEPH